MAARVLTLSVPCRVFSRLFSSKFLSADEQTIICYHPTQHPSVTNSKPIRPLKRHNENLRDRLQPEEIELVKRLRSEDASVWSVNTLASLFNVRQGLIRKVAPASKERQMELDKDRTAIQGLPLRQRRSILAQRETARQTKLQNYLKQLNYDFPGLKK